ncbi:alpha/beta hydrolase [Nonomuraea turkmeniaca]|uniref:Alpha/beta hydrolase n=1 Tax=Nonomuraea turkmeniaca TaxID=103838 RepID=A0A5S4F3D5_9ACTN|nr:alpha/beta hydrolase fold domain-containing protein [Nonomuraea turkmeniaca]TMR10631.1 alpha/beta hydrolase [Nonomuraea turkmeniaca]
MSSLARPALDPELNALLTDVPLVPRITPQLLTQLRGMPSTPVESLLEGRAVDRREITVPAPDGAGIPMTVLAPAGAGPAAPCVYWMHGGGMIMGDRFSQLDIPLEWLDLLGAVVVTVDYRLAPEAGGATPVEDCYRGLLWIAEHAGDLGIDPSRVVVAGASAGGGLAAGVTLMARDRGTPPIAAQVLICPMLDHRNTTTSSRQYAGEPGVWTRESNEFAWNAVLGDLYGDQVPAYVSPATAEDLSGLPTTYIDAGSAEVFRDEDVEYATRIWGAGGQAELHVWAGGFHGFDALFPRAALSAAARETRTGWLARTLDAG